MMEVPKPAFPRRHFCLCVHLLPWRGEFPEPKVLVK